MKKSNRPMTTKKPKRVGRRWLSLLEGDGMRAVGVGICWDHDERTYGILLLLTKWHAFIGPHIP
jgi:hypothetical protein